MDIQTKFERINVFVLFFLLWRNYLYPVKYPRGKSIIRVN